MQTDHEFCGLVHCFDVEMVIETEHEETQPWVLCRGIVTDAVDICPVKCGETRIKALRRLNYRMQRDVIGKHVSQPVFKRVNPIKVEMSNRAIKYVRLDVDVAHLMSGVHTGISSTSNRHSEFSIRSRVKDELQGVLKLALHGAQSRLTSPT